MEWGWVEINSFKTKRGIIYSGAALFLLGSVKLKPYRRAMVGKLKGRPPAML